MRAKKTDVARFMRRTIALSLQSIRLNRGGPFAALVVRAGRILAEGTNAVTVTNDPTAHAEIVAIRMACKKLSSFELRDCEIYTSCEPCPMCLGAIYWARPARIYFAARSADAAKIGFDDSLIYKELKRPMNRRRIPVSQLMRDDALEVFRLWNTKRDKMRY